MRKVISAESSRLKIEETLVTVAWFVLSCPHNLFWDRNDENLACIVLEIIRAQERRDGIQGEISLAAAV